MEERNDRRDLYEEFESEVVKRGNTEAFFDENDLVEIYDYASDFNNYIVKMEVLLYGAVHYPKSEALATRRAWMYYSLGDNEATEELNKRVTNKGILNRLLSIRARYSDNDLDGLQEIEVCNELDEILDAADDFEDEEIIQLVDLSQDLGLDWAYDKKDKIVAKCSYPQTFLYELADRLEEVEAYEPASQLFEELTMLEPFTIDFWLRLGGTQINLEDYEGAKNSAEYALAIDPTSIMAMRIKGAALYRMENRTEEVIEIYRKIYASGEVIDSDIATLSAALVEVGKGKEAMRNLREYLAKNPDSRVALDVILVIDPEEASKYLRSYFEHNCLMNEEVIAWAKGHAEHGQFRSASTLLEIYCEMHYLRPEYYGFLTEIFYFSERFRDVIKFYEEKIADKKDADLFILPAPMLPYIMSLARIGKRKKATAEAERIFDKMVHYCETIDSVRMMFILETTPSNTRPLLIGYLHVLQKVINALKDKKSADEYDPLINLGV